MSIPLEPVPVPEQVRRLARGATLTPIWRNNLAGLTFRAVDARADRFIKWAPRNLESSLADEVDRLHWAAACIRVPEGVSHGGDETHEWLVTIALPGQSAVAPR